MTRRGISSQTIFIALVLILFVLMLFAARGPSLPSSSEEDTISHSSLDKVKSNRNVNSKHSTIPPSTSKSKFNDELDSELGDSISSNEEPSVQRKRKQPKRQKKAATEPSAAKSAPSSALDMDEEDLESFGGDKKPQKPQQPKKKAAPTAAEQQQKPKKKPSGKSDPLWDDEVFEEVEAEIQQKQKEKQIEDIVKSNTKGSGIDTSSVLLKKQMSIEAARSEDSALMNQLRGLGGMPKPYPSDLLDDHVDPIPFVPKPITVVTYTSHFFGNDYNQPQKCMVGNVDLPCYFTADHSKIATADAVWFHGPSFSGFPDKRAFPTQKYAMMSMESSSNYPVQSDPNIQKNIDLTMTYRIDDDVPALFPSWVEYGTFMEPPLPFEQKKTDAMAAFIQSNCVSYRDSYVQAVMKYMDVHSYGRCLHNRDFDPAWKGGDGWFNEKLTAMRQYKFAFLFENSVSDYYVTERLFNAFQAGTVPVYYGASQIDLFGPSNHSIIHVSDFESPYELAQYLTRVGNDKELYESYLSWKKDGYSEQFKKLVDISNVHSRCRLCVKLAHKCTKNCHCGKYPDLVLPYVQTSSASSDNDHHN